MIPPLELQSGTKTFPVNHSAIRLANKPIFRGNVLYETHVGTLIKAPVAPRWRLEIEINAYDVLLFSLSDDDLIDLMGRLLDPNQSVFVKKSSASLWHIPNLTAVVGSGELYVGLDGEGFEWSSFLRALELRTVFNIRLLSLNLYTTPFKLRRSL